MSKCNQCQCEVRLDYDRPDPATRKPYTVIDIQRELPHVCRPKPNPIAKFDTMNGITFDRRPESLALAITNEALRCGLDPFKVRVEVRGEWLILH
jgi:hypothetical protein